MRIIFALALCGVAFSGCGKKSSSKKAAPEVAGEGEESAGEGDLNGTPQGDEGGTSKPASAQPASGQIEAHSFNLEGGAGSWKYVTAVVAPVMFPKDSDPEGLRELSLFAFKAVDPCNPTDAELERADIRNFSGSILLSKGTYKPSSFGNADFTHLGVFNGNMNTGDTTITVEKIAKDRVTGHLSAGFSAENEIAGTFEAVICQSRDGLPLL